MELDSALREWTKLVGQPCVLNGEDAQTNYGRCTTGESRRLAGALRPFECDHIIPIVKIAAQYKVPLYPVSTGHNWGYGTALPPVDDCVILDLSELNRIVDFNAETGVVTVEPGVTQGQLAEFLDQGEYPFMVPVTGAGPTCSILGNALERGYGITPHTDHFGAVLAIQAVLADGSVYQSAHAGLGSEQLDRAFKWGIGPYLDGIFSQGNFGVVTQMSIALARRPETVRSFLFGLKRPEQLGELVIRVREVITRYPGIVGGINLMNAHRVLAMTTPYPGERVATGETISPGVLHELCQHNLVMPWTGFGTLYGSNGVVKAAQREIRSILSPLAVRLLFVDSRRVQMLLEIGRLLPHNLRSRLNQKLAMLERSLQLVAGYPNQTALPLCYWLKGKPQNDVLLDPARDGCGLIWYAPLVPMQQESVIRYVQMISTIMNKYKLEPLMTLTSLSDRCFDSTVPLIFDPDFETGRENAENCYWELLEEGKRQGFLPYRVGIQTMSWLSENGLPYWQVVRRIKNILDPDAIISPGRYA
ncbi:FAD-binding oxidoreductase [Betaproteobacteria bacterium PRO5]|nr:FAD-binding oxidoreductase [Betaproteobacteria bacterium PRO5]